MLVDIERERPDLTSANLAADFNLALELWEKRGALTNAESLTIELNQLLSEIAGSMSGWDQDKRDNALALIQALAARADGLPLLNGEQQAAIGKNYIEVVDNLQGTDDWLGSPWTALELGHSVSAILGKEIDFVNGMRLRGQLSESWSNYAAHVSFDNRNRPMLEKQLFDDSFKKSLDSLQKSFLSRAPEAVINDIQRNGPGDILTKEQQELTLWYGQAVGQSGSAKLNVLRATPNYVSSLKNRGLDIANFWNLNDAHAAQAVVDIVLTNPIAAQLFEHKFENKVGVEYSAVTADEKNALADLNLNLARDVYGDLYKRVTTYGEVQDRIMNQVEQARLLDNPRKKLKPVLGWLRQIDPGFSSYDPAEIKAFISNHQTELKAFHERKNDGINDTLRDIESAMPPQPRFVQFMDRSLFDLKSANLTADCTAWNLDVGFNAWTVPVWVTNPSFNFAYIYSGNTIAAKLGLILAFDKDQKPQVVIDSIETNKNLPKEADDTALEAIYAGFRELQQWADRNGFGTLQVCTFTNSEELTAELPIEKDVTSVGAGLTFDGLLATEELMRNIDDRLGTTSIYLQARAELDEFGNPIEAGEYVEGADEFETIAQRALDYARNLDSGSLIQEDHLLTELRSGDKDRIFIALVEALVPDFAAAFTFDYETVAELYKNCRAGQFGSIDEIFSSAIGSLGNRNVPEWFDDHEEPVFGSIFEEDELDLETYNRPPEVEPKPEVKATSSLSDRSIVDPLVPKSLEIVDYDAFNRFMDNFGKSGQRYTHILDILDAIIGADSNDPNIDIAKAARYVFGSINGNNKDKRIIDLMDLPLYDRRELVSDRIE